MFIKSKRTKAIEAYRILNEFIGDLFAGTQLIKFADTLNKPGCLTNAQSFCIKRMCISHLILTLAKWIEFYKGYKSIIPGSVIDECKNLNKNLENRKVIEFRNKAIGHIFDKDSKEPLTIEKVDSYLRKIYSDNLDKFILWVNDPINNFYKKTVIGTTEYVRDEIMKKYALVKEEIFPENI